MCKFTGLKEGCKLYHCYDGIKVIETEVKRIESNANGIYVYAEDKKGQQYRFIVIVYSTGKTTFGKTVFTNLKDLINKYPGAEKGIKYKKKVAKRNSLYKKKRR